MKPQSLKKWLRPRIKLAEKELAKPRPNFRKGVTHPSFSLAEYAGWSYLNGMKTAYKIVYGKLPPLGFADLKTEFEQLFPNIGDIDPFDYVYVWARGRGLPYSQALKFQKYIINNKPK